MKLEIAPAPVVMDLEKASPLPSRAAEPQSFMVDPMTIVDVMGWRRRPGLGKYETLSYQVLRRMSFRDPVVASIIQTRQNQVAAFSCPSNDARDNIGYAITMRNGKDPSRAAKKKIEELTTFIQHTGYSELNHDGSEKDDFDSFLRKLMRDTLVFDQTNFEIVRDRKKRPHDFFAVDAASIRRVVVPGEDTNEWGEPIVYVQVIDDSPVAGYSTQELVFGVRNPRTDLDVAGYGFSELEMLITIITSHLNAISWNSKYFTQGTVPKGILNIKGSNIPMEKLEGFRRQWHAQVAGVMHAWQMPIINADDVQFVGAGKSNVDMEFSRWMEYLVKVACGVFLIDPTEINFDFRGSTTQTPPMFESSQEAKLKHSQDKGLRPILRFVSKIVDTKIIEAIDSDFKFTFSGLDARTEKELLELDKQEVTTFKTIDEKRAERGLQPLPDGQGGYVSDPNFIQWSQQQAFAQQQEQMGGGFGEEEMGEGEVIERSESQDRKVIQMIIESGKR